MARSNMNSLRQLQYKAMRLANEMAYREQPANRVSPVTPSVVNRIKKIEEIYRRYEKNIMNSSKYQEDMKANPYGVRAKNRLYSTREYMGTSSTAAKAAGGAG